MGAVKLSISVNRLDTLSGTPVTAIIPPRAGLRETLSNALIITRREVRDSLRDWRIIAPILILTFLFPSLAQFTAQRFTTFFEGYGADVLGDRMIPFLLMIVGFFPISISLVIALETFVGEKERKSLEPLLSTPLTNTELYIGKTLAAMLPPLVSSYGGMFVYLSSLVAGNLAWRPQPVLVAQIIILTTVQALVMITGAVVVSSQTTSTRAANLLASFIIIPMALVIQGESAIMFLAPDAESASGIGALWAIIVGMIVVVVLLLRAGNALFNREELLGRTIDQINIKYLFRNISRAITSVDSAGTPARNLFDWFVRGVGGALGRLKFAALVTTAVFVFVFIAGILFGQLPGWQLNLPRGMDLSGVARNVDSLSGVFFGASSIGSIFAQNVRILLAALLLGTFTFGSMALVLTPAVYFILGYVFSQVAIAGYNPLLLAPAILTHGIVEIPIIIVATAIALRIGGVVTHPPRGQGVGAAWTVALGDTFKLWVGIIIPGLLLAAAIEALITPRVIAAFLSGA